ERRPPGGAFAALTSRGYRIYLGGQSLANTGSWMQSIAQDWLIFSLTRSSTAVGVTMALQFLPMLLLGLHAGALADRLPKKRILLTTQLLNAAATLALAAITISGAVRPADVYAFALLAGVIFAFDAPARQSFVTEVVPPDRLRAAISLNAAVFQATRLIGPAIASVLIVSVGTGWVFALNAACYLGPTVGLLRLRPGDLQPTAGQSAAAARGSSGAPRVTGSTWAAVRYVRGRPDVLWTIFLVGMAGTFGLNFPIVLTAMAKSVFHGTASTYGLFNIVLAVGSSAGALLAGAASRPRPRVIVAAAAGFGLLQAAAAVMPGMPAFLPAIAAMGFVNLMFQAMANAYVQLAVDPELRGRVMGLYMLVFIGGTPIGAPVVGAITSHFGARAGMATCGIVAAVAAVITAVGMARCRRRGTAPGNGGNVREQPSPRDQEVRAADHVGDGDEDGRAARLERGLVEQHRHR
ncbi:MAG: major facilitator superfamily 1, partial [Actinomycetia bacterium]|nr:major facilitator superfamily 1 [Actinomycetes bacterium]